MKHVRGFYQGGSKEGGDNSGQSLGICILKIEEVLSERWQMGCENNIGVEENYKSLSYSNDRML